MLNKAVIINNRIVLRDVAGKPTIIIDKSTLESLSNFEIHALGRYYLAVSTHVLLNEIGADLKKEFDDERDPEEVVSLLSNRMHALYRFNTNWYTLLELSLLGHKIPIDHMAPVYLESREAHIPGIGRGMYFDEQEERETLFAWANGEFGESDYKMAEQWRSEIDKIDLKSWHQDLDGQLKRLKSKSFDDVLTFVEDVLNNPKYQFELLQFLVKLANVSVENSTKIFNRWNNCDMPEIKHFSKYGYYCMKVYLIFWWALYSKLVGPRSTHCVDLHYLYELPFCRIFSSNDKFHKNLSRLLLTDEQIFISGQDLKSDLRRIEEYVDSLSEEDNIRPCPYPYPPDWEDSFTNQVWRKYVPLPREDYSDYTDEEKENILRNLRSVTDYESY